MKSSYGDGDGTMTSAQCVRPSGLRCH